MVIIVIVSGKSYRVVMMQDDADWRTEQLVIHVVYCQWNYSGVQRRFPSHTDTLKYTINNYSFFVSFYLSNTIVYVLYISCIFPIFVML